MRRKDREITDIDEIRAIMNRCDSVNLGLCADDLPYVVPLSFGYAYSDGQLILYFHCAHEGKKLAVIQKNPNAFFSMDCARRYIAGKTACASTTEYESVMGAGMIEIVTDADEKRAGLLALMRHFEPEKEHTIPDAALADVTVLKLAVKDISAKRRKK